MARWKRTAGLVLGWLVALAGAHAAIPEGATPVQLVEWPMLSPDGKTVVFEWLNHLWSASVEGGEAVRLTDHSARDTRPHFTPDGRRLVFSSNRTGSFQVFSMAAGGGGENLQHSFHSEGGLLECLSPDGTRAIISGKRELAGPNSTRLLEVDLSRSRRERCLFDAYANSAACSPDGGRMLFCRGGERPYRKGESGSRGSQLWLYRESDNSFLRLLPAATDARSPLWQRDGKGFYYVSRINGVANLCSYRESTHASKPLTFATCEGISQPSMSADEGTFMMLVGWQLCRLRPETDAAPVPLELWTRANVPDVSHSSEQVATATDADFSPDLDQVVFAACDKLWLSDHGRNPPLCLTKSSAAESEGRFSRDGEWLYFLRDDGLEANYFRAAFSHGRLGEAEQLTRGQSSKCRLKVSPDGKYIAWVEGNGDVFRAEADGSKPIRVFQSWDKPTLEWSPCGHWLALGAVDPNSNRDIWLAAADGSRPPLDLTRNPAFDGSPRWSPDGRFLVFTSRRGLSNKAGLWRIDFGVGGLARDMSDEEIVRCGELATPLSTRGMEPSRVIWTADSKSLLLQNDNPNDHHCYSLSVLKNSLRVVAKCRGVPIRVTPDGGLLLQVDGCPAILREGEVTSFPILLSVERRRDERLRLGFRRIWRTLGERFYDPSMKGADWPALRIKYEDLAVGARDSRQFERVIEMLLAELNSSHLGFVADDWPQPSIAPTPAPEVTAHPGLVFRDTAGEGPLVIARVLAGSPVGQLKEAPQPGETLVRIAGRAVNNHTPLEEFFTGAIDRPIPLVVQAAGGGQRVIELRCITYEQARSLEHEAREGTNRNLAATPPHPRLAYLAWTQMAPEDVEQLELAIYRASLDHDGLILDVRDNAGGSAADQVLAMFCQPKHVLTVPRGGPPGYPVQRRSHPVWDRPLVILCNENTCSNAEVFCHAIQQSGRAPLVGSATAACVISTVEEALPDLGRLQLPFRGWFDAATGNDLEGFGVLPDQPATIEPTDEVARRDPQLQRALEVLRATLAHIPSRNAEEK